MVTSDAAFMLLNPLNYKRLSGCFYYYEEVFLVIIMLTKQSKKTYCYNNMLFYYHFETFLKNITTCKITLFTK